MILFRTLHPNSMTWLLAAFLFLLGQPAAGSPPSQGKVDALDIEAGTIVIDDRLMTISPGLAIHGRKTGQGDLLRRIKVGDSIGYHARFTGATDHRRWILEEIWLLDPDQAKSPRRGPPMRLP